MEALTKAFEYGVTFTKAVKTEDGRRFVSGPISTDAEDYDGDKLNNAGILKGMEMFQKLGSQVDFEHLYRQTRDLDTVIGKGVEYGQVDGVPHLTTELLNKPLADKLWRHLGEGDPNKPMGTAGYSIEGKWKKRNPADPKEVLEADVHLVTITLQPKSFGSRIRPGAMALSKAVLEEIEAGNLNGWEPLEITDYTMPVANELNKGFDGDGDLSKALTTGEGIVPAGATGGEALRVQSMAGEKPQKRCHKCGAKNLEYREKCRKCGASFGMNKGIEYVRDSIDHLHRDLQPSAMAHFKASGGDSPKNDLEQHHAGAVRGILNAYDETKNMAAADAVKHLSNPIDERGTTPGGGAARFGGYKSGRLEVHAFHRSRMGSDALDMNKAVGSEMVKVAPHGVDLGFNTPGSFHHDEYQDHTRKAASAKRSGKRT